MGQDAAGAAMDRQQGETAFLVQHPGEAFGEWSILPPVLQQHGMSEAGKAVTPTREIHTMMMIDRCNITLKSAAHLQKLQPTRGLLS